MNTVSNPTAQTLTTTYQEITGSKCEIKYSSSSINLMYKFTFYSCLPFSYTPGSQTVFFSHFKLQKSTDNFVSNIIDMTNYNFNFSGDTEESGDPSNNDWYMKTLTAFFIIDSFDSKYLRLMGRAYDSNEDAVLHRPTIYDGLNTTSKYYAPNLKILEL